MRSHQYFQSSIWLRFNSFHLKTFSKNFSKILLKPFNQNFEHMIFRKEGSIYVWGFLKNVLEIEYRNSVSNILTINQNIWNNTVRNRKIKNTHIIHLEITRDLYLNYFFCLVFWERSAWGFGFPFSVIYEKIDMEGSWDSLVSSS